MTVPPGHPAHGLLVLAVIAASVFTAPSRAGEDAASTGVSDAVPGAVARLEPAKGAGRTTATTGSQLILRLPADGADRLRNRNTSRGQPDPSADAPAGRDAIPRDLALHFVEPEAGIGEPAGPVAFHLPAELPGSEPDRHLLPWHRDAMGILAQPLAPPPVRGSDTAAERPITERAPMPVMPVAADQDPYVTSQSAAGGQALPAPRPTAGPATVTAAWTEGATMTSASVPERSVSADAAYEAVIASGPPEEVAAPPPAAVPADLPEEVAAPAPAAARADLPEEIAAPAPASIPADPPTGRSPTTLSGQDPIKLVTIPLGQSRRWVLDHHATAVITATPEVADVRLLSPELLYVIGKGVGRTSVAVLDDQGLVDEWLVDTVLDLEPVHAFLASDPAFSEVRVQRFARGVTLTGEVASVGISERVYRLAAATLPETTILANEIHVTAPQQVNLEVQIAEVQRSVTESLGINWEAFNRLGVGGELLWKIGRPQALMPTSGFEALAGLPADIVEGQPANSVAGRFANSRGAVQGVVDALANAGLANILARPSLTAISGETASFFSGGEYPLPVGFRDGMIVFEYKKYGVLLDFIPTIVNADRITLTVRPEVSETSNNQSIVTAGVEIPVINARRAETTVEVGNGESIVIAGLFRSGSNRTESGVPGLKDLPVFGLLFRQDRTEASETELIVVVTANLVHATNMQPNVALPSRGTQQIREYHF